VWYELEDLKMDSKQFWKFIDDAKESAGGWEEMYAPLVEMLSKLSDKEIVQWGQIFDLYQKLSYKDRLWAAAYVINGGCSDDGFDYFRGWLTAQGKDVFLSALSDPDSLVELEPECEEAAEFEDMLSVSTYAYFKKHNLKQEYGRYDKECDKHPLSAEEIVTIESEIVYAEETDFDWSRDENLLKKIVPRLCEYFEW
jgi:hypothetical protein